MITGLCFVILGVLILFYPQILIAIAAALLILFGLGLTPPPALVRQPTPARMNRRPGRRTAKVDGRQTPASPCGMSFATAAQRFALLGHREAQVVG